MNIKEVDEIKFPGVVIDKHLGWSFHANKLLRDHRPAAGLFIVSSNFVPKIVCIIHSYTLSYATPLDPGEIHLEFIFKG